MRCAPINEEYGTPSRCANLSGMSDTRPADEPAPVVVDRTRPNVRITGAQYGEGDRIGAEQGSSAAPGGDGGRSIRDHQRYQPGIGETFHDDAHDTAMVRAANAGKRDALFVRHRRQQLHGLVVIPIG